MSHFPPANMRGATNGRAFGWGGSTSRWGGLVVPHIEVDARNDDRPESGTWDHIVRVVRDRSAGVAGVLGLDPNPDFLSFPDRHLADTAATLRNRGLRTVAAAFVPFGRRNLTCVTKAHTPAIIRVYLNAVVTDWSCVATCDSTGEVSGVEAVSPSLNRLRLTARRYVIAAGAIESARILLELDRSTKGRMLPRSARIGCYLSDHLSSPIADVHPSDRDLASRTFGPVFYRDRLRSFRFIDAASATSVARHFAHFIFNIRHPGFGFAKDALARLQCGRLPRVGLTTAGAELGGLASLAYARYIKSRLMVPAGTSARLHLDMEQTPSNGNRVSLGTDTDRTGRPSVVVHWDVSADDRRYMASLASRLLARWPGDGAGLPRLLRTPPADGSTKPHEAYHPVGTCRMGRDAESIADHNLRVKGTRNLYALTTGLFPSAGTANPTFSMLCLGDRLADHLATQSKSQTSTERDEVTPG